MTFKPVLQNLKEIIFENKMITSEEQIREILPPHLFDLMVQKKNIKMLFDQFLYRPSTQRRKFDTISISKMYTPDFDLSDMLERIVESLENDVNINVDFDFVIEASKDELSPFKFEYASKSSSLNKTKNLVFPSDVKNFLDYFKNKTDSDILQECFIKHVDIMDYSQSGFQPYVLLAVKIFIAELL